MCSSGLEALTCPFSTKLLRSTDLRFTTSPAIATYTLLPAGLPSFVSLYLLSILSFRVIVCCVYWAVCRCIFIFFEALGNFLKTILSALTKQALLQFLVCVLACANCKCACFYGWLFRMLHFLNLV